MLVLNTLPFAPPSAVFSSGLIYRFRLRPVSPNGGDHAAPFAAADGELVLDCVFSEPVRRAGSEVPVQEGVCSIPGGNSVTFWVHDERAAEAHGVRAFAGVRWDPFILDAPAALKTIATGELAFADSASIYLDGKNVLSLVIEIDCARVLGTDRLFGVLAETLTRGEFNVRLERAGRPEVHNLMLAPKQFDPVNRDLEIRDLYNMDDGFHLAPHYQGAYRARLNANLAFWDSLDGNIDWPAGEDGTHPLTDLILADYLVVDVGKPYAEHGSFLEIELAARRGETHRTCGGRALNDDVMDTIFTVLVNAGNGPTIRDGIDQATRPASRTFPYLAPANPNPPEPPGHA